MDSPRNDFHSPLDTLRQLKEWLDAGTITPQEFETLKRKLLFDESASATPPPAAPIPSPAAPVAVPPVAPAEPTSPPAPITPKPEPHVTMPPVEDPLLPPIVDEPGQPQLEPVVLEPNSFTPTEGPLPETAYDDEPAPPAKQPLATVLIVGGVIALLALVAYLLLGNRESERLTSNSITPADTTAVAYEEGPQAEQLELPVAQPETIRVQPVLPATTDSAAAGGTFTPPAATPPAESEDAVRARVQRTLTALYNDLEAAPFNASQHFAPQVERFYTQQNVTPATIEDELNRSHFPEFTESQISFDPNTLQVSPVTEDGSVTVTYQERGRSFRKSRNQYQQTVAQVRARLDRSGKLVYFRQERLLENTFTDPAPAAAPATE